MSFYWNFHVEVKIILMKQLCRYTFIAAKCDNAVLKCIYVTKNRYSLSYWVLNHASIFEVVSINMGMLCYSLNGSSVKKTCFVSKNPNIKRLITDFSVTKWFCSFTGVYRNTD